MGCVIYNRDKNKNYGLININQESYNNFINDQINNNNNMHNNIIRIYNNRNNNINNNNNNRNDNRNINRNSNRNSNRYDNRNDNRNSNRNSNRNNNRSSRQNIRNNNYYNNLLNNILNNSYVNNIHYHNSNRNIFENGSYFFIPHSNLISNRRSLSRRRNIHHTSISPQKRKINSQKKHFIKDFPEIEIKDISKLEEGKKQCTICLEDFIPFIKVVALPCCLHFFHPSCIEKWIKKKKFCPICKFELTKENIEKKFLLTN